MTSQPNLLQRKREFIKANLEELSKLLGKTITPNLFDFYLNELQYIDLEELKKAFRACMAKGHWPTVEDIETMCGQSTVYSESDKNGSDAINKIPLANLQENFENWDTYAYRIEAPHPANTDLHESVKFWNKKIVELGTVGWKIFTWKEFEGVRKQEVEQGNKTVVKKQRVFYAMAFVCKPGKSPGTSFGTCDFKADNAPYAKWELFKN